MAIKSVFDRGGDGMTTGGLDRFLAPPAQDHSNLPDRITEPVAKDEGASVVNCGGADKDQSVCQLAEAERAKGVANSGEKPG